MNFQEEKPTTYVIPPNYKTIFKWGEIKGRNIIEGICFTTPVLILIWNSLLLLKIKIVVMFIVAILIMAISIIGINNESILQFCFAYLKFISRKRVLHLRRIGYVYKSSKGQKLFKKSTSDRTKPIIRKR